MNVMICALGLGDLLEHGLEALLELAAVHRTGHQRGDVEGDELFVLEALGDVARDDALGEAFDDGCLADAGLADQHGVVLRATGEHLADPADLAVAPDHGVELALAGTVGEVDPELLEGALLVLLPGLLRGVHCLLKSVASAPRKVEPY